ncbi:ABC transporter substrate-binding protein [Rhodopirellula sp. ICT_H3.1]|uniref:ABC transporter substrate-binding protein n=2 Tax=Aporhodopirellula aestuarii TaxID=2950107 RepID=A0ABT0UAB1_9BACT|nr:ABC transporter substrate-binding protein [Aporhodopirellula aestuarii]
MRMLFKKAIPCLALVFSCSFALMGSTAHAEIINYAEKGRPEDPGLELLQEDPHDIILFKESAGGGWVKTRLLDLPGRSMPSSPKGQLKFRVIGIETKDFVAKWDDVEMIDFWEKRLERETADRIKNGDFTGAYPFLAVLIRDYPSRPNLRTLRSEFLMRDAGSRYNKGEIGPALAMLEELHRYAPEYKTQAVLAAISMMTDGLMKKLMEENKLELAQKLLARLEKDYLGKSLTSIKKWNQIFLKMAEERQAGAIAALKAENFREARRLSRESIYLKPTIPNGKELVRKIDEIYPLVNVGVLQTAKDLDPTRLDNWAARRAGRLMYRVLFEMKGAGPEGGEYEFLFGETELSPDRMKFSMLLMPEKLEPPLNGVDGFFIADRLAARVSPQSDVYFSPWAAALKAVGLDGPKQIDCILRRPNVLPSALLQMTVDGSWFGGKEGEPTGDYRRDVVEGDLIRYTLVGEQRTASQPREIVEIRTESASEGVAKLLKGEVDVLDQLFPADAVRLESNRKIRVARYPLPSVHMLVPCSDHAFLAERTFRRALVYGTNREDILAGELLESLEVPGCQVLSGPFPAGIENNDPLGYAYDKTIAPRRYEPRLAKLLMTMNANQLEATANRKKEKPPELKPIRLAFPPENLSRSACEAIKSQWELLELKVELVELPVGEAFPKPGTADLAYVAAAVWEPIIDARRVLGPEGMAGSTDQLVGLGLRRLEESKNWKDARDRLLDLHFISHHELPVIPLWQLVDSYAYNRNLLGVGSEIVSLYQNAEKWRLSQ